MPLKTKIVKEIARISKTDKHETRVVLLRYNDGPLSVDIRKYYKDKEGKFVPAKGIALPTEDLKDLRRALHKASKFLEDEK